jgi:hypothetical protein
MRWAKKGLKQYNDICKSFGDTRLIIQGWKAVSRRLGFVFYFFPELSALISVN